MRIAILLSLFFISTSIFSQCVGLRVIGFNSDNPDEILMEAVSDIPGNTLFYITDNEWIGGSFNSGENIVQYTTPAAGISSGSTILISGSGPTCGTTGSTSVPALSTSGEEIYITSENPSGSVAEADICFSVLFGGTGDVTTNGVDISSTDNAFFNGSDILNPADWSTSNSRISLPAANCLLLPVNLIHLSALNNEFSNKLSWSTAAEVNNSHFEILHSNDGRDYTNIGKVEGNGNTSEITEYTFTHENVKSGNHFYKLKQVDFDGQFEVFGPVAVNKKNTSLRFFPTTAGQSINFEGEMDDESYQIYSLEGRLIQSGKINHTIDISAIPNGMYYIKYAEKTEQLIKM